MSAGWVAASVRARAMVRRRVGRAAARELAGAADLDTALSRLARSPYARDLRTGQSLSDAERAVVATCLWNIRVLSGWLPREGVAAFRVLLSPVEAANVVDLLLRLTAPRPDPPPAAYRLGALTTAWTRLADATTPEALRSALAGSAWGDPGGTSPREVALAMRLTATDRVASAVPDASGWAGGAAALVLAREIAAGRSLPARAHELARATLGPRAAAAGSLADLAASLPGRAGWALADVEEAGDLWRAEGRWWARVERDAWRLVRASTPGPQPAIGAVALLAADAWRVRAALEGAARHGTAQEDVDAVA